MHLMRIVILLASLEHTFSVRSSPSEPFNSERERDKPRHLLREMEEGKVDEMSDSMFAPPSTAASEAPTVWEKKQMSESKASAVDVTLAVMTTTDDMSMEMLSAQAYASLMHSMKKPNKDPSAADRDYIDWQNRLLDYRLKYEYLLNIRHIQDSWDIARVCYCIGVTYMNAMQDLRKYFKIRYLYTNTMEYELGYIIQQIVFKYQLVLELFHMVQAKFVRFRNFAPPTYMFYMYTNILEQCKNIIHLCNMLHEVERKYKNPTNHTVFEDYHTDLIAKQRETAMAAKPRPYVNNKEEERIRLAKQKQKEKRKQRMNQQKKPIIYTTKKMTAKPKSSGRWEHHYGWSIESW